jgi:hypothetical protein
MSETLLSPWRSTWLIVSATMALSLAIRIALWWSHRGFLKGDDVEILEAALRYGVGLDYVPWDLRNLTLPLLLAPVSRLLLQLDVTAMVALVDATVVPFILVGTLNIFLTFQLARRFGSGERLPLLATLFYAFHWIFLVYGSAPFPRVFATAAVLGAALTLSEPAFDRRAISAGRGFFAGSLVGLAVSIRYSEVLFLAPLLSIPFLQRDRGGAVRQAGIVLAGFAAACFLLIGIVDWLTWGAPFASLLAFFDYTLIERDASALEPVQPPWWYIKRLLHWLPATALPLLFFARRDRWMLPCWLFAVLPIIGLSLIHHKEIRYLQAVMPFVAIVVASGAESLLHRGRKIAAWSLIVATLVLGASRVSTVEKRSMAAVEAAFYIAESTSGAVALSQPWAYGNLLYLGGRGVLEIGLPPTEIELRELPLEVRVIGLYDESLRSFPDLHEVLTDLGFRRSKVFSRSRSEAVVLYERASKEFRKRLRL